MAWGQVPHPQELFGSYIFPSPVNSASIHNLISASNSNFDVTVPTAFNSDDATDSTAHKMFSRTARAVSRRALATSVRPIAAPVSRQIAPLVAQPQRRPYHEKVLDRTSPAHAFSASARAPIAGTPLTFP